MLCACVNKLVCTFFLLHILFFSPHLCAGFLFLVVHSRPRPPRLLLPPSVLPHHHAHTSLTHNSLTHTQLTHTHTQLTHTQHNLFTHAHNTTYSHTHTSLSHTQNSLSHQHRPSLCVAGVALMALDWLWWRAWFPVTPFTLRGRCGTSGTGLALVARLVPVCRRGHRGCLCGRCGTWRHRPSLCAAAVVLGDIDLHFAWQVWHLWH